MKLSRPRLADHALPRRHRIDGVDRVALHDAIAGAVYLIGAPEWEILRAVDGTRDLDGIVLAAARFGVPADASDIGSLLDELAGFGILVEGVGPRAHRVGEYATPAVGDDAGRPVVGLPGYTFACEGGGECCRRYGSIALSAADVVRADHAGLRSFGFAPSAGRLLPLRGGDGDDRVTLPLVDGACSELDVEGRCGLHARGGATAKPSACGAFPRTFADDGEVVRVSIACECSCVFTSLEGRGESLVAEGVALASDLPPGVTVRKLPESIAATTRTVGSRAAYLAWNARVVAEPEPDDVPGWLLAEVAALEAAGEPFDAVSAESERGTTTRARLDTELVRLRSVSRAASRAADAWRSDHDTTRVERRAVAAAIEKLDEPGALQRVLAVEDLARDERFFLRATLFGHGFVGVQPVAESLVRAAGAIVVARLFAALPPLAVPCGTDATPARKPRHPLSAVIATLRGMQG